MTGKGKCKILKDIRREIAARNDIAFVTSECKFQGECSGTCPKCEAEVRYLEQELAKRQKAGKAIAVAGIAAALMVGVSGCTLDNPFAGPTPGELPATEQTQAVTTAGVPLAEDLMGEPTGTEPTEEVLELMGDIAYVPDETEPPIMGGIPLEQP